MGRLGAALGVLLFFTLLAAAMFAPLLDGNHWFLWDVPDEYWPDLHYLCGALRDGVWPLWNPYDRFGYPFHADPQAGLYYPLNHALCLIGRGAPSLWLAGLRAPLHFILAGCAMTGFLRLRGIAWGPSLLGGVVFMIAPFQRRMWEVNLTYTVAYLPVLLCAIERLAQRPDGRRAAELAVLAALATSVGSPPSLYFSALTAGVFALARCGPERATWRHLALALGLTLCLTLVMVVPTRAMALASVQQAKDFRAISADGYALKELVGLVVPRNKYLYFGAPVVVLSVLGAGSSALPRSLRVAFGALGLYALAMMFGDHTPLFRAAFHVVPGARAFRSPPRYSAVLGAALAVLSAAGATRLPKEKWSVPAAIALILALAWPTLPEGRDLREGAIPGAEAQWNALRARLSADTSSWRAIDEFGLGLRAGTRFLFRDARGYQDPLQSARYATVINSLGGSPELLEQFGVRYLFRGPHFIHGEGHHFLPVGAELRIADSRGAGLWETQTALPTAYWVARAERFSSAHDVFERLRAVAPAPVCLLEAPGAAEAAGSDAPAMVEAERVRVTRNEVRFEVSAPAAGWVVVNEAWDAGWRATVDGRETPVLRANYLMRAVRVGAGRHRVAMVFAPRSDRPLRALAAMALVVCAGLWVRGLRARSDVTR